ncbi:MAG TPA: ABC transporter permease [Gemmatimonadaceae bacterium]|nr:ABC transporter permease [Gemmatimonadaceae bacterium]
MRILAELRERAWALLFRAREEREMAEEIRFHIQRQTEQNLRAGMRPDEARRQALLKLGGVERFKEEWRDARGVRWLEDLSRDARYAMRRLTRERGFSIPVIVTLALGIGVTAAVFALVNAVLLKPLPYPQADRLVAVGHTASRVKLPWQGLSPGTFLYYGKQNRVFESMAVYVEHLRTVSDPGTSEAPERVRMLETSPSLFSVLHATPYLGRFSTAADFHRGTPGGAVLISYDLWARRYGADRGILGRTIEVDRTPFIVVGVAQPGFHFPTPDTQIWAGWPQEPFVAADGPHVSARMLFETGIARLKPGITPDVAQRDLQRLVRSMPDAFPDITTKQLGDMGLHATVTPLKDVIVANARVPLLLLSATAAFLLLITWANVTNLSLIRSERERREVAMRRALGATDGHLVRRFLMEGFIVAAAGGVLGLVLAYAAITTRFGFARDAIPRLGGVHMDNAVVAVVLVLSLASALLLSGISLLSARRSKPAVTLAGGLTHMTVGRREQSVRRLLVAAQVALALTLLVGSALMARSFCKLTEVTLGFRPANLLTFYMPVSAGAYPNYRTSARIDHEVLTQLRALPGIEAAEAGDIAGFPLAGPRQLKARLMATGHLASADSAEAPYAFVSFATAGYFRTMGIPLMHGRPFKTGDMNHESPGVILSASLARALFGSENPMGKRVQWAGSGYHNPPYTVVGVVGDVPSVTIRDGPSKVVYFPNVYPPQADTITNVLLDFIPDAEVYVLRTTLPASALLPAIRRAVRDVDPTLAIGKVATLQDTVADSMAQTRLMMLLLLVAATTALALGVVGLYGVLAYAVAQRRSELGLRIALGATPASVTQMVARQGVLLALVGIAAGILAAFALTRFLGSLLYQVSPGDPSSYVAAAALLFVIALAASYLPARRAAHVDPIEALRVE